MRDLAEPREQHVGLCPRSSLDHCSGLAFALLRQSRNFLDCERSGSAKLVGPTQRARANAIQQIELRGFERDQAAEDVQQVEKVGRVFGQQAGFLNSHSLNLSLQFSLSQSPSTAAESPRPRRIDRMRPTIPITVPKRTSDAGNGVAVRLVISPEILLSPSGVDCA
jgi:hypothetical protein